MNRLKRAALPLGQRHFGDQEMATTRSGGSKRGFAAMDPAKQREIASKGGKASHGGGRKASVNR
jgi:general stress protein YciG